MNKEEKEAAERKYFKEVGLIPGLIKYHAKEILGGLLILAVVYILSSNVSCSDGKLQWIPSIKTNININK